MTPEDGFAIMLIAPDPRDVASAAPAVSAVLGTHPSDAARRMATQHGIVARRLAEEPARAISRALDDLGLRHLCLAETDLVSVPRAVDIATLNFQAPQHLIVATDAGEAAELPWDTIAVLCAGRVDTGSARRHDLADVLPVVGRKVMGFIMPGAMGRRGEGSAPPRTMLCLAGIRPEGQAFHYRAVTGRTSFACLQDAVSPAAAENLHRLATELRKRLPHAATNISEALLMRPSLAEWPVYISAMELERVVSHRLQVVVHGSGRGGAHSP